MSLELPYRPSKMDEEESHRNGDEDEEDEVDETVCNHEAALSVAHRLLGIQNCQRCAPLRHRDQRFYAYRPSTIQLEKC